jgi:hypothetical protein
MIDGKIIDYGGAAIYLNKKSLLECIECTFINNTVNVSITGGFGGAIFLDSFSTIEKCVDCKFNGNGARYGGSVALKDRSIFKNCSSC